MNSITIAAIASGLSNAGISIIRISGPDAFNIADSVFTSVSGKSVHEMKTFTLSYGHIHDKSGEIIDEVLLIKMAAPSTYTREDVIEIDCHGGVVVTRTVLNAVIEAGARPAEPGEFTKRAFLNGRIDLSQAEAVSDIIASKSSLALKNSINQLQGNIKIKIGELRDTIIHNAAYLEAALDDPEHYNLDGFGEQLMQDIVPVKNEIDRMIKSSENGRLIKEGINTVIIGLPNAGKSSLLNYLTGTDRAIVTDIAGTTRDTLEESISFNGLVLNLIDTAGIRETDNVIEQIGVKRTLEATENANLILYLIDSVSGISEEDLSNLQNISSGKVIILLNKIDMSGSCNTDSINSKLTEHGLNIPVFEISAKTGAGVEELKNTVYELFFSGQINFNDEIYITNARHKALLCDAFTSLNNVIDSINAGLPEDFYTIDLMDAYTSLGLITGDNVEDDLADRIFSEFCMGK